MLRTLLVGAERKRVLVEEDFTTSAIIGDTLNVKLLSPAYVAVMAWVATARAKVVKVALPAALSVPVPSTVVMSLKMTVPVAAPAPGLTA